MRILMISDVYFPRINGVSTSIQTFKQELEAKAHQVWLLVPDYPTGTVPRKDIFRIPSRRIPFDREDRMMHFRKILKRFPELEYLKPDLIHIHTPFVAHYAGIRLARKLGIPAVLTYHTLFEEYLFHYIPMVPRSFLRALARRFSRSQCNQVEAAVAPSSVIVELLQRYGVQQPISIIPTGIHCDQFRHGDGVQFREKFNIAPDAKILLNVSRVAFEKNIGLLLEALKETLRSVPQACLVIAGEGPAKNAYMKQAREMELEKQIRFVGYLDRETELLDCYHSADFFVFASTTETQGLVLLESMAAGTPVVSVAAMGARDILIDCPAACIVKESAHDFAKKLTKLLTDDDAAKLLRNNTLTAASVWDSAVMAEKMIEFYDSVILQQRTVAELHSA